MEQVFLSHTYRWVKAGGILVLVIPGERIADCGQILATQFRDARVYRLGDPACVRYKQVVVLAVRQNRRERQRLQDSDITRARLHYDHLRAKSGELASSCLPILTLGLTCQKAAPSSSPIAACRLMKSRSYYRGRQLTGKRVESCLRSHQTSPDAH